MREKLIELLKYAETKMTYEEMIDYLLKNDVRVVTKCKNCKYWESKDPYSLQGKCELYKTYTNIAWYCANGRVDKEVEQ